MNSEYCRILLKMLLLCYATTSAHRVPNPVCPRHLLKFGRSPRVPIQNLRFRTEHRTLIVITSSSFASSATCSQPASNGYMDTQRALIPRDHSSPLSLGAQYGYEVFASANHQAAPSPCRRSQLSRASPSTFTGALASSPRLLGHHRRKFQPSRTLCIRFKLNGSLPPDQYQSGRRIAPFQLRT